MAHTDILDERLTAEGPVAKSSTFAVRFKPFMGKSEGSVTIAEYEPPRRVQLRGRMGKMAPDSQHRTAGDSSRFTRRIEMEPPGILRLSKSQPGGWNR